MNLNNFEHLILSYKKAAQGHTRCRPILRFDFYLEREILQIQKELVNQKYKPRPKKPFIVYEPKQRKIFESHFRDRVVHHALCSLLNPHFEKRSLTKSYACRKGYGNLRALNDLRMNIQKIEDTSKQVFILKIDVRKYFDSISHDKLLSLIKRDCVDAQKMWLTETIIRSYQSQPKKGLPIGNLTSQVFANLYLNELDYFIVHKKGFKHLFRFMDDLMILHHNRDDLVSLLDNIQTYCQKELGLEIHPNKIRLVEAKQGVEFLGFRVNDRKRTIKPANMARIKKRLKRFSKMLRKKSQSPEKIKQRLKSWMGYACHGQIRFQLDHLINWAESFDKELSGLCRQSFLQPSKELKPVLKPQQLDEKSAHSVFYQSPLDQHIRESESDFFQALQWR